MNIDNLNKLIAHLEAESPERINMAFGAIRDQSWRYPACGTCGCLLGHAALLWHNTFDHSVSTIGLADLIGISADECTKLTYPNGWREESNGVRRYPAHRVIATLKRLRGTYLSTGQVVVDWGPEPGEEPKQAWTAPQVAEVINPALPAELTSLLRNTVEA